MTNHRGRQVNPAHQKAEPNARRYALHRFGRGFVGVAACCNASFNCFAQYLEESYWSGSYRSVGRKVVLYPCRRMSVPHEKYILEKIVQGFNVLQHPTAARGYFFRFGWLTNRVGFVGECHSGFGFMLEGWCGGVVGGGGCSLLVWGVRKKTLKRKRGVKRG